MPWKIERQDDEYCVIKISDGSNEGCHATREEALDQMQALYASEGKVMTGIAKIISDIKELFVKAWSTAYVNDLPDSSFLFIEPDCDNKGCRHLPYKDANGKVDLPHLRNALSRLGQSETGKDWKGFNRDAVMKKAQAILARQNKEAPGVYTFKDINNEWWLLGIVTNNRMDREEEILTADSHRSFVKAIEDGSYEKIMGHARPEFWVYHIPVPVGDAQMVAYDERGFLITAIKQRAGEFYSKIFEGLSLIADTLGMSHGMPTPYLKKENGQDGLRYIVEYLSKEFTALPLTRAANFLTSSVLAVKELYGDMFEISAEKRKFLVETFGEELADTFDQRVKNLAEMADAVGLPKKEFNMPEEKEEEVLTQEAAAELKADTMPVEDEEEEEEDMPKKKQASGAASEPQYMTQADAGVMVKEILDGLTAAFATITARIDGIEKQLKEHREEEDQARKQIELTPYAGLASQIAKSVIGREETVVDGRKKEFKGPQETDPGQTTGGARIGIASIDQMIQSQRAGGERRVIPGFVPNGQR